MPLSSRPSNYNLRVGVREQQASAAAVQEEEIAEQDVQEPPVIPLAEVHLSTNMSGVFKIECFKGDGTQKIESYLKRFDQYQVCVGLKNEQAFATLAWHLDGTARLWFESLDPQPTTLEALKESLSNKFKKETPINMNIYSLRQEVGETVETFLCRLEKETFTNKIPVDIQVQIALNGMDRTVGSAISTHAPKCLDDIKKLTLRMAAVRQPEVQVAQVALPSRLETNMEVLTAAVAQLTARLSEPSQGPDRQRIEYRTAATAQQACSRCGGRCFSMSSCRAMGKTCFKCNGPNHFRNKCISSRQNNDRSTNNPNRYYRR